eukprot:TRINITY_DN4741_c0_g1_i4.p1 TRINITY_DN4741_c0_g1~~TRINITY_DN4741_c0_g1_i4.p1  ORF type:complete len:241 (-),score=72.99 TRINITY_DN4741_c0_g1_i4:25-747(-)
MKNGAEEKIAESISKMDAFTETLKNGVQVEVKIQNHKAIKEHGLVPLKGDAELRRIAWSITHEPTNMSDLNITLASIMESSDPVVVSSDVVTSENNDTEHEEGEVKDALVAVFQKLPKNDEVLALVNKLDNLSLDDPLFSEIPMNDYLAILRLCGIAESKEQATLLVRQTIRIMLADWQRDPVQVEEEIKKKLFVAAVSEGKTRNLLQYEGDDSEEEEEQFKEGDNVELDSGEDEFDMFG